MSRLELVLVRHGESVGNVAREAAESSGAEVIVMSMRDPDVPLSPLGEEQATALGRWLAPGAGGSPPNAVWCSPYLRARRTAERALGEYSGGPDPRLDERLRDRELGVLDLLTSHGVRARFPGEAERRRWLGKFYYRPPGGESWADVVLRIRSFLSDLDRCGAEGRHLIVSHDAVILLFRYVCEQLDEVELFDIVRQGSITNASVTRLVRPEATSRWQLESFNDHEHLERFGVQPTEHPGELDAAR
ncbi:MAG: hypothetical protein QOH56_4175 [Pseudonocardiales bacterium]|jgi:broad specificity phosphatase PhoE|nr:hypothetical protein [Pseudonocardiales bacterium]